MNPMRTAERNDGQDSELSDPSYDLLCRPGEDAQGRLLALTAIAPLHLSSLIGTIENVIARFPKEKLRPGEAFLVNAVGPATLAAAAREAGADVHRVFQGVYESVQYAKLKLLERVLIFFLQHQDASAHHRQGDGQALIPAHPCELRLGELAGTGDLSLDDESLHVNLS